MVIDKNLRLRAAPDELKAQIGRQLHHTAVLRLGRAVGVGVETDHRQAQQGRDCVAFLHFILQKKWGGFGRIGRRFTLRL